jgi:capsid protein
VATGLPWIDPLKEVQANVSALGAALTSRTRVLKEMGIEFEQVAQELASENELLTTLGLPVNTSPDNSLIRELVTNATA